MARKMKDSGIEWIGEIPENWKISRNKQLFFEVNEKAKNNQYDLLSVSEYYGVALKKEKISDDDFISRAENFDDYKICNIDDLVINIMLAWKKGLGVSEYIGIVSPAYCVYRKKSNEVNSKYYHYLFRTDNCALNFKQYSTGIIDSRLRLYSDKFFSLYSPQPSLEEQTSIYNYLDNKCTKIDETIEKEKQVIEKLKEYKQSVITEAVTKGLNSDAPVKDSGIEWIGKIPEHWEVKRLRYIARCQNGISKSAEYFGTGFPFVTYGDVYRNSELPNIIEGLVESSESDRKIYSVEKGDIFFTRTSETIEEIGLTCVAKNTIKDATFAGFLIRVRTFTNEIDVDYSKYYFSSNIHRKFFVKEMNLVTRASLSQELLKKLSVILPSIEEQKQIADYLDEKCTLINKAISNKERLIEKLTEYKKSLIYECVTGKKEV